MFEPYNTRWGLIADGEPFQSLTGCLLPVRRGEEPAILKVTRSEEEIRGGAVLEWWGGGGAARVFEREGNALLLERATGSLSLAEMARGGADDAACEALCSVAERLHAARDTKSLDVLSLPEWFRELEPAAEQRGGTLRKASRVSNELLANQHDTRVLHGDLHHGNVLDFGERGWLAIDPKGLIGDRYFDYCNLFTNPDLDDPARPLATRPGCFARRLEVVTKTANLDRERLLRWILAWTGLSAAWFLGDGDEDMASIDLTIAEMAAHELRL